MEGESRDRIEIAGEMIRILAHLDLRWYRAACSELATTLFDLLDHELPRGLTRILGYQPKSLGEPNLLPLFRRLSQNRSIYFPEPVGSSSPDSFLLAKFGDEANDDADTVQLTDIPYELDLCDTTLIIVPILAYDQFGAYIEQPTRPYLSAFRQMPEFERVLFIGVGWSLQLVPWVPSERLGTLDWICHERGFFPTSSLESIDPLRSYR